MAELHDANNHDQVATMLRDTDAGMLFRQLLRDALQELIETE